MGVGRYVCVALPFILTVASIICGLIAGLTGVSSNNLHLFRIDITNLSVDVTQLSSLINNASDLVSRSPDPVEWHDSTLLDKASDAVDEAEDKAGDVSGIAGSLSSQVGDTRIYAANLSLANIYDFNIWGYCMTSQNGSKTCTKAEFDWATKNLNTSWIDQFSEVSHLNLTIPDGLNDGLNTYKTVNKWTEVVYIISMVALGLELFVGLFSAYSRGVSCLVWLISGFATAAVIAAAVLMTVMGSVVVGAVLGVSSQYGVKASVDTSFLATIWIGVAFALGASLFWLFSACCCKSEKRSHKRGGSSEKFLPPTGSYAPIGEHQNRTSGYGYNNFGAPQRGGGRSDLAYEPYSHSPSHV
ncbi:Uu.00g034610.m01.CDS01 [Anthostomella pinea]|uniref:Uu.00g034610.m01.CDS01 n=1 Tax=Anthostomella pinea TaxID=933095 RepID=A0AAI8V962_9PEZI|nr:Uu.00g034610.m01.CDS01 [Anthostomella pinea]